RRARKIFIYQPLVALLNSIPPGTAEHAAALPALPRQSHDRFLFNLGGAPAHRLAIRERSSLRAAVLYGRSPARVFRIQRRSGDLYRLAGGPHRRAPRRDAALGFRRRVPKFGSVVERSAIGANGRSFAERRR